LACPSTWKRKEGKGEPDYYYYHYSFFFGKNIPQGSSRTPGPKAYAVLRSSTPQRCRLQLSLEQGGESWEEPFMETWACVRTGS